jgi:hypothetical protein
MNWGYFQEHMSACPGYFPVLIQIEYQSIPNGDFEPEAQESPLKTRNVYSVVEQCSVGLIGCSHELQVNRITYTC